MKKLTGLALIASLSVALPAMAANPNVEVTTTMGNFTLELYPEKAPKTVENFLRYVEDGSYVGTQFHRVIPGFVVQGGGYDGQFVEKPSYAPVINESKNGLSNQKATIAMARTQDPNSATRQFYINLADNKSLDATAYQDGYAVFGLVTNGFDTIEKIAQVKTSTQPKTGMRDVPVSPILIEKIQVMK